jgi:predicted porin
LSLTLLFASQALARLGVEPSLTVREEYDDNIFLDPDDEESDFLTTVNPGLAARWDARYFNLVLDYGLELLYYRDHSEFDETSLSDTQRARAEMEILPEKSFSVRVLEEYYRTAVDLRRPAVETNPIVNKTNVNHFLVSPSYRLGKLPSLQATFAYQYDKYDYSPTDGDDTEGDDTEGDDNLTHTLSLNLARQMSERLVLTLNSAQLFHQAETDDDFRRQDLTAGFNFKAGPKLTLRGDGGVSWVDFKDRDDETSNLWDLGADLRATPRLTFSLAYSEGYSILADDGLSKTRLASGTVGYQGKIRTDFRLFAQEEDFQTEDRKDRSAGGALTLRIPLGERLDLRLHGRLAYLEFLPEDDDVRRASAGAALEYQRGLFKVSLGYNHHDSQADQDNDEYRNNIVFLMASVTFWRSLTDYQESQTADETLPFTDQP